MSQVRANSITNAAGTGAPDFPNGLTDNSNAVLNSASSLPAANLTGTLPAIDGSALTNLPGSVTHLGTMATTSGFTVTLSGLTLTTYKFLTFSYSAVSFVSSGKILLNGSDASATAGTGSGAVSGGGTIDLTSGVFFCVGNTGFVQAAPSGLTTASTSISFTSSSAFDAGSIRIYGVK